MTTEDLKTTLHEMWMEQLRNIDYECDELDKEIYNLREKAYNLEKMNDILKRYCKKNKIELVIPQYSNEINREETLLGKK